jgi:phosphatidate cytidylyltransferase
MKRILTAAALIPLVVYVVLWANDGIFLAVVALVASLSYFEFDQIAAAYNFGSPGPVGYGAGLLFLYWRGDAWLLLILLAPLAFVLAMRDQDLAKSLPRAALLIAGVVYLFGSWRCAIGLHDVSPHWLMFALLVNWVGDIGAYYVGRNFGRHKLAPRVSPNKSWEGSAGSVAASLLIAGAYLWYFLPGLGPVTILLVTLIANAAGQVGDLAESAMKRGAGVKDSGAMLPGHGGFLDRVDSTLFVLPVAYALVRFLIPA